MCGDAIVEGTGELLSPRQIRHLVIWTIKEVGQYCCLSNVCRCIRPILVKNVFLMPRYVCSVFVGAAQSGLCLLHSTLTVVGGTYLALMFGAAAGGRKTGTEVGGRLAAKKPPNFSASGLTRLAAWQTSCGKVTQ